jgi:hypothetical protein
MKFSIFIKHAAAAGKTQITDTKA